MSNVVDYEDLMEKCDPGRHAIGDISLSSIIYHSVMLLLIIALLLTGYASKMPLFLLVHIHCDIHNRCIGGGSVWVAPRLYGLQYMQGRIDV